MERRVVSSSSLRPAAFLLLACFPFLLASCQSENTSAPKTTGAAAGPTKVKLAYLGLTCEAAMFAAQEKGFFKDEGLDVEFVKTDWDGLRDGLGLGRFDANYTLIMYLLKPIEQGLDVKITGGIHSGCLRVQTSPKSSVESVADLKGKKIGIPTMGSPPFLFASRALSAEGLDPKTDVSWVVIAPDVMGLALKNGQVDAIADSEPLGSILAAKGDVKTIADQAIDAPYRDEYCCATVVSGKFLARDREGAAKVTRAMLKGAMWVDKNPSAAAELSVERKYVASSVEINSQAIGKLAYRPGVTRCRDSLLSAAKEMKVAQLLNPSTDPMELAKTAWIDLDGVTDEWLDGLEVETVAGGGRPVPMDPQSLARLLASDPNFRFMCCDLCCDPGMDDDALCRW